MSVTGKHSGPCATGSCPHHSPLVGKSCCMAYNHYLADICCPSFTRTSEVERLRAENAQLRAMNQRLVRTGRNLANHNRLLRNQLMMEVI